MGGIIRLDPPQQCGCYLDAPANRERVCGQPATFDLNYSGIAFLSAWTAHGSCSTPMSLWRHEKQGEAAAE